MKNGCKKCGKCCKGTMGPLIFPSDVEIICRFLKISHQEFYRLYCEQQILSLKTKEIIAYSIRKTGNACTFLSGCLCKIYKVRPYQCRMAPYKFLSESKLWGHLECLDENRLKNSNSSKLDKKIFKELLEEEYQ